MTIAQTSQLIQLILNSVLMIAVCIGLLSGLRLRHSTIIHQLQSLQQQYTHRTFQAAEGAGLALLRSQRQHLQRQYRLASSSHLLMHYVVLLFIGSTFALATRTLLNWGWLIPLALFLFVLGTGGLLISVALALLDFYHALQRPRAPGLDPLPRHPPRFLAARRRRRSARPLPSASAAIAPLKLGDG
ncbi:DUF2721 domain-containing protein [Almyronema epifaneia]|uniref:DUF2721 domain-containing protein n=1 Tax=Almyronema epifaneia S1 TaxID=2991925 RepID=A0ABW6IE67_9CYAN